MPVPAGSFFVLIDALPGSTATVTASQGGSKQLTVTKSTGHLNVAPFSIVSTAAGQVHCGTCPTCCTVVDTIWTKTILLTRLVCMQYAKTVSHGRLGSW